jgi:hypothetical protein
MLFSEIGIDRYRSDFIVLARSKTKEGMRPAAFQFLSKIGVFSTLIGRLSRFQLNPRPCIALPCKKPPHWPGMPLGLMWSKP